MLQVLFEPAALPLDVLSGPKALHRLSSRHRKQVELSEECGCFYCLKTFAPKKIHAWVDKGDTAVCPFCEIDAVLPSHGLNRPLSQELLEGMRRAFFVTPETFSETLGGRGHKQEGPGAWPSSVRPWVAFSWPSEGLGLPPLTAHQLRTDRQLRSQLLEQLPWLRLGGMAVAWAAWVSSLWVPAAVASQPAALMAWVAVLAIMASFGARLSKQVVAQTVHCLVALRALSEGRYQHPSLAQALGALPQTDYTPAPFHETVYREAKDWARAIPELSPIWKAWHEPNRTVRRHDLRHFVAVARVLAGSQGPYAHGDPL